MSTDSPGLDATTSKGPVTGLERVVEGDPHHRVGDASLKSWLFYAAIVTGGAIGLPIFAFGGGLGAHQRFLPLVRDVLIAGIILALIGAITSQVGIRARLPTAVLIKQAFGEGAARIIAAIFAIINFGWFGVSLEMPVKSAVIVAKTYFGITVHPIFLIVPLGSLMCLTATIGYRAVGKVVYVATPLLLAVILVPLVIGLSSLGVASILGPASSPDIYSTGFIVSSVIGGSITVIVLAPDFSRFVRTSRGNLLGNFVSYMILYPSLLLLAAALAALFGSSDLIEILSHTYFAPMSVMVILLAAWTSNELTLYGASLSLATVVPSVPRWKLTIFAGLAGTVLANFGIFGHLIELLGILGVAISPIASIYVIDYFIYRSRYEGREPLVGFRPRAFVAWLIGSGVGLMTTPTNAFGFGYFTLTEAPVLDALIATTLIFLLIELIAITSGRKARIDRAASRNHIAGKY